MISKKSSTTTQASAWQKVQAKSGMTQKIQAFPLLIRGNPVHKMADSEIAILKEKTQVVTDKWIADQGSDGQALFDDANALLDKYSN